MAYSKAAHHKGKHQRRADKVRAAAHADPTYRYLLDRPVVPFGFQA